eukprot:TRINITY_DN7463_c0_g1_i1.p1 TRINITY_DN7463_c0_g1~~TRINITY_DN7463_c0_g1_i1.p1  ORF type:complete len:257 (+),score=60.70 TRINITY_DN7463_c0_g1_i1:94-864(+)
MSFLGLFSHFRNIQQKPNSPLIQANFPCRTLNSSKAFVQHSSLMMSTINKDQEIDSDERERRDAEAGLRGKVIPSILNDLLTTSKNFLSEIENQEKSAFTYFEDQGYKVEPIWDEHDKNDILVFSRTIARTKIVMRFFSEFEEEEGEDRFYPVLKVQIVPQQSDSKQNSTEEPKILTFAYKIFSPDERTLLSLNDRPFFAEMQDSFLDKFEEYLHELGFTEELFEKLLALENISLNLGTKQSIEKLIEHIDQVKNL